MPSATPSTRFAAAIAFTANGRLVTASDNRSNDGQTPRMMDGDLTAESLPGWDRRRRESTPPTTWESDLEGRYRGADVNLVLEVEEEGHHPDAQHPEAQRGQDRTDTRILPVSSCEQKVPGDDHHAGNPSSQEQVDGNLQTPDLKEGINQ